MKIYSEWERDCGSVVTKIFCASSRDCRHLLAGFFMHHSLLETRRTRITCIAVLCAFLCVTTTRALFVLIHLPSLLWSNNGSITLINEKTAIVMAAQLTLSTPAFFPVVFLILLHEKYMDLVPKLLPKRLSLSTTKKKNDHAHIHSGEKKNPTKI